MSRRVQKQEVQRQFTKFVEEENALRLKQKERESIEAFAFEQLSINVHLIEREMDIFEKGHSYSFQELFPCFYQPKV